MSNSEKSIILTPSRKNYFWGYLIGVLLIPLFIGVAVIWFVNKKRNSIRYQITDTSITKIEEETKTELELVNILETSFSQTSFQKLLGIGTIRLKANVSEVVLDGIEQPASLLNKIDTAIAYQKERFKASEKVKPQKPTHDPGTLEKLDYLTGLWQQGLINDEDYDQERKKFS
ncbi:MAG TPA: hypothetical protein DF712_22650 [Balneola sp.]|jgi:hypothetical protein|nr:hypothetical protein [Bacteroidota bacterium]HCI69225.1 hypothetical protein [Balneola sp.]HCT55256.1 hypothetical protein [Balneola sp.]|tara:strand:+ start:1542 stop:2060 length:519 start_codon:yes stop_codon:yes gene_type:complete